MPFLLPILSFLGSKAGIYTMMAIGAFAGLLFFIHHERDIGAERCIAVVKEKKDAEVKRETDVNSYWLQWANGANQENDTQRARINALEQDIAVKSAANDHSPGLNAAAVSRLRGLSRTGGQASAAKPAAGAHR